MEVRVFLENSHDLGGVLVSKRTQRCVIRHKLRMRKVTRRAGKELSYDTRDRHLSGSLKIARGRVQEYLLWWIKKSLRRAVEHRIEFFLSRIRLSWEKR